MEDQNVFYPGDVVRILDKIDGRINNCSDC